MSCLCTCFVCVFKYVCLDSKVCVLNILRAALRSGINWFDQQENIGRLERVLNESCWRELTEFTLTPVPPISPPAQHKCLDDVPLTLFWHIPPALLGLSITFKSIYSSAQLSLGNVSWKYVEFFRICKSNVVYMICYALKSFLAKRMNKIVKSLNLIYEPPSKMEHKL